MVVPFLLGGTSVNNALTRDIKQKEDDLELFKLLRDSIVAYNKRNIREDRLWVKSNNSGSIFTLEFRSIRKHKIKSINDYLYKLSFIKKPHPRLKSMHCHGIDWLWWGVAFKRYWSDSPDGYYKFCTIGESEYKGTKYSEGNYVANEIKSRYTLPYQYLIETLDNH